MVLVDRGPRRRTLDRERTSRTLIESECRTWAQRQVRAEYAPRLQDAARLQWNSALMGSRTFDGVSVATVQGREWELFDACRVAQLLTSPAASSQGACD